ncbi:MAG TPA: HNH endonuclease signature motif containing protein [Polyangiaceae bacterium]|jgi:5-methylcytosine-specific restriction endonuclease McrA|nr:HNH endonuclease signature motif containing protein [Polyangiaceae bacterium]
MVLERDGLACSWVNVDGTRCASRAWLEIDHRHPRAKGGGSEADNLRILCRAHNQLAAELEYGRAHMDGVRARRARP